MNMAKALLLLVAAVALGTCAPGHAHTHNGARRVTGPWVAGMASASSPQTSGTYKNQPIVPAKQSGELSTAGNAFVLTQSATTTFLPQGYGWCKNNVGCASNITNGNSEQCYSIFYPVPRCVHTRTHATACLHVRVLLSLLLDVVWGLTRGRGHA
jgi:hypothetical protein